MHIVLVNKDYHKFTFYLLNYLLMQLTKKQANAISEEVTMARAPASVTSAAAAAVASLGTTDPPPFDALTSCGPLC